MRIEGHSELNCGLFGLSEFILSHRFNYENVITVNVHFSYDNEVPAIGTGYTSVE